MNAPDLAERIAAITGMPSAAIARLLTRGRLAVLGAEADQLCGDYLAAQRRRQADEKALNDVRENETARQLFHGLEPHACPRCDTPISEQRRREEHAHNRCAICSSELPGATEGASEAEVAARLRLAISEADETTALARLRNVQVALARSVAEATAVPEQRRPD
ncbi:hypothetical protein GCM10009854_35140 [Saccharopolyspora halophila]|uniref:Uncharacterized protein n=1 Tax=Saccharopolyspora halophila TaxID=405551 RepID=A0ABN3GKF8_9PSEU